MADLLERLSRRPGKPSVQIEAEAVRAWGAHEIASVEERVAGLWKTYHVASPDDLEAKIRSKAVDAHPAWEDIIRWESLE